MNFSKNHLITLVSQMLSLFLAIGALKIAALIFDSSNFGLYNVVRRYLSILSYPLLIGLGISIPINLAKSYKSRYDQAIFVSTALIIWLFVTVLAIVFNFLFPGKLTFWILGEGYNYLAWPILFGFSSLYLYTVLYSVYRGEQNFNKANLYQIFCAGLFPILALYLSSGKIVWYFLFYAIFMFIGNFTVLFDLFKREFIFRISLDKFKVTLKQFFYFGLPRIPGEFALFGLMSCPLFFIARYDSLEMAGYVAIGFTLVQLVASFFEFIGTLILPKSAQLISDKKFIALKSLVNKICYYSFFIACILSGVVYLNLSLILSLLDKTKFSGNIEYSKIIILCIPFYVIYLVIRNPQDALVLKPINTFNLSISFLIQLSILIYTVNSKDKILFYQFSIIIPFILLGVISFITWNKQINKRIQID